MQLMTRGVLSKESEKSEIMSGLTLLSGAFLRLTSCLRFINTLFD